MDGNDLARVGSDFLGFNIERLPEFSEAAGLQAAVARDVGSDSELLTIALGLNTRIEPSGRFAHLNVQLERRKPGRASRQRRMDDRRTK